MQNLKPSYFFDLSLYKHASLFQGIEFVWEAFSKIDSYLKSPSPGIIETEIPTGAFLVNPETISIGKGTEIEPGAYIKGPCLIGENCTIRHGAYIRGNLICGDHCVIGHDTEIKNAILLDHSHAAHFAYVGDTILGNHVNLGAGTKCANLKFDHSSIQIDVEGHKLTTSLRKFGAIFGDYSQTGCNAVTGPGTLIGKGVFCYPCVYVKGFIPPESMVKNRTSAKILAKKDSHRL